MSKSTTEAPDIKINAKARYIGNISGGTVIIPDLKNSIDEHGLSLNAGESRDLALYYTPQEINRSRGLDKAISGSKDPITGKVVLKPSIRLLDDLNEELPAIPKPPSQKHAPGTQLEAGRNFADDNLEDLANLEKKELEKISRQTIK